jgi:hypothetical protein
MRGTALGLLLGALALAPAASAAPIRLSDGDLGPILAGDEVVQATGDPHRGYTVTATRLEPPRTRRIITRIEGIPRDTYDLYAEVTLAASAQRIAFTRSAAEGRTDSVRFSELWSGPLDGPISRIERCTQEDMENDRLLPAPAVDGDAAAYMRACQTDTPAPVFVSDSAGTRRVSEVGTASLQMAGRYLGWGFGGLNSSIEVIDWTTGERLFQGSPPLPPPTQAPRAYALEADGRIGMLYDTYYARGGESKLAWFSLADRELHVLPGNAGQQTRKQSGPLAFEGDRLLYVSKRGARCNALTLVALDGRSWPVACAPLVDSTIDMSGDWVAWSAAGCSGSEHYAVRRLEIEAGLRPRSHSCPVRLASRRPRIRLSERRTSALRLRCSRGCEGTFSLRRRSGVALAEGYFELDAPGGRASVSWTNADAVSRLRESGRTATVAVRARVRRAGDGKRRSLGRIGTARLSAR